MDEVRVPLRTGIFCLSECEITLYDFVGETRARYVLAEGSFDHFVHVAI